MTLPTAVASGMEAKPDDEVVPVRPVRAGVVAGVLAALYLIVVYVALPVPGRFVRLVGGRGDSFGLHGGVRILWQPPAGYDMRRLGSQLEEHGTQVTQQGDRVLIDIGDVTADDAQAVIEGLTQKPLQFHEVLETKAMGELAHVLGMPVEGHAPIDVDIDQWRPEDGGGVHTDYYLRAPTRAELDATLAKGRAAGWSLPPGSHIGYEHTTYDDKDYWRTYVITDEVALDGNDVSTAIATYDPNTNRPVVLLEMTRAGATKFGELTERISGRKLATMTGDEVKSAPIINGPIRGGRASITMGGTDPRHQEHERDVLVKVLRAGMLPAGGTVISQEIVPPADGAVRLWLARGVLALIGGGLVGLLAWIVVRVTRPVRRRLDASPAGLSPASPRGPWPASRVLVTAFVPIVAVLGLSYLRVPTLDYEALGAAMGPSAIRAFNLGLLGLAPLVTAYLAAELLAVTVWRERRHAGPYARRSIRDAFVVLAILFTALQAWMVATYLQSIDYEDLMPRTGLARFEVIAALGLATAALAAVAGVIRRWGLGNGYGALISAGWCVVLVRAAAISSVSANIVLIAQILAVALVVSVVLRWRVYSATEAPLRVPTSGVLPAAYLRLFTMVTATLAFTAVGRDLVPLHEAITYLATHPTPRYVAAVLCVVAMSAAFAWPAAIPAASAGLARPSWSTWARATGISVALTTAIIATVVAARGAHLIADLIEVPIVAAVVLDAYADLRARRATLVRVWTVHSAQRADLVERQLRDAGIPCHLSGAHLRTLLGGFGAFAPIDVLVVPEHEQAAQLRLAPTPSSPNAVEVPSETST